MRNKCLTTHLYAGISIKSMHVKFYKFYNLQFKAFKTIV